MSYPIIGQYTKFFYSYTRQSICYKKTSRDRTTYPCYGLGQVVNKNSNNAGRCRSIFHSLNQFQQHLTSSISSLINSCMGVSSLQRHNRHQLTLQDGLTKNDLWEPKLIRNSHCYTR